MANDDSHQSDAGSQTGVDSAEDGSGGSRDGRDTGERVDEMRTTPQKNPGIAALASLLLPGAGHVYNGQFVRGIAWFVGAAVVEVGLVAAGRVGAVRVVRVRVRIDCRS